MTPAFEQIIYEFVPDSGIVELADIPEELAVGVAIELRRFGYAYTEYSASAIKSASQTELAKCLLVDRLYQPQRGWRLISVGQDCLIAQFLYRGMRQKATGQKPAKQG